MLVVGAFVVAIGNLVAVVIIPPRLVQLGQVQPATKTRPTIGYLAFGKEGNACGFEYQNQSGNILAIAKPPDHRRP